MYLAVGPHQRYQDREMTSSAPDSGGTDTCMVQQASKAFVYHIISTLNS